METIDVIRALQPKDEGGFVALDGALAERMARHVTAIASRTEIRIPLVPYDKKSVRELIARIAPNTDFKSGNLKSQLFDAMIRAFLDPRSLDPVDVARLRFVAFEVMQSGLPSD